MESEEKNTSAVIETQCELEVQLRFQRYREEAKKEVSTGDREIVSSLHQMVKSSEVAWLLSN